MNMNNTTGGSSGGMDHGGMGMGGCKISMLWNWYTIDACFLSESWRIQSSGGFAASCFGVIALVMLVEFFRRLSKEYDSHLLRSFQRTASIRLAASSASETEFPGQTITLRATFLQQAIRAILHAVTFGAAYIVMLLAMYFNGYIIICIFIGAGLGKFVCDWLEVKIRLDSAGGGDDVNKNVGGIQEPTVCCG